VDRLHPPPHTRLCRQVCNRPARRDKHGERVRPPRLVLFSIPLIHSRAFCHPQERAGRLPRQASVIHTTSARIAAIIHNSSACCTRSAPHDCRASVFLPVPIALQGHCFYAEIDSIRRWIHCEKWPE